MRSGSTSAPMFNSEAGEPACLGNESSNELDRGGMFQQITFLIAGCALIICVAGCESVVDDRDEPIELQFDFDQGAQGWEGHFVDYPVEADETEWQLETGIRDLPPPLDTTRHGFFLSGNNHSDDLFMYLTTQVGGLTAGVTYRVSLSVDVATNAPSECVGIGGAPGESVYLKAGASAEEPERVVDELDWYRLNIDKGNQADPGTQSILLGHIGNSNTDCLEPVYEIKRLDSAESLEVTTNDDGLLWLFVGTDSGFEGQTSLYYTAVRVMLHGAN